MAKLGLEEQMEAVTSVLRQHRRSLPGFRVQQLDATVETLGKLIALRDRILEADPEDDVVSEQLSEDMTAVFGLSGS